MHVTKSEFNANREDKTIVANAKDPIKLSESFFYMTKKENEFGKKKTQFTPTIRARNDVSFDYPDWAKIKERTKPYKFKERTISLIGRSGWITVDAVTRDKSKALEKQKRVQNYIGHRQHIYIISNARMDDH